VGEKREGDKQGNRKIGLKEFEREGGKERRGNDRRKK
jgi:hypothetical protein